MTAEKTKEEIMAEAFEQIAIDHVSFFDSRPEDEREEYFSIIRDAYDLGQQQNAALIAELEENFRKTINDFFIERHNGIDIVRYEDVMTIEFKDLTNK